MHILSSSPGPPCHPLFHSTAALLGQGFTAVEMATKAAGPVAVAGDGTEGDAELEVFDAVISMLKVVDSVLAFADGAVGVSARQTRRAKRKRNAASLCVLAAGGGVP